MSKIPIEIRDLVEATKGLPIGHTSISFDRIRAIAAEFERMEADRDAWCKAASSTQELVSEWVSKHDAAEARATAAEKRVEELERHVEELQAKINPETDCCCSYDEPGQICAVHSPRVAELEAQLAALKAKTLEVLEPFETSLKFLDEVWVHTSSIRGCGPDVAISPYHLRAARALRDEIGGGE